MQGAQEQQGVTGGAQGAQQSAQGAQQQEGAGDTQGVKKPAV